MKAAIILTVENANKVATISNLQNPEWGVKSFNYNAQQLNEGKFASTVGRGSNSKVLFENEYKFWKVESFK